MKTIFVLLLSLILLTYNKGYSQSREKKLTDFCKSDESLDCNYITNQNKRKPNEIPFVLEHYDELSGEILGATSKLLFIKRGSTLSTLRFQNEMQQARWLSTFVLFIENQREIAFPLAP